MKRFIVFAGFFLIVGAGCAHTNSTKPADDNTVKPNASTAEAPTCGVEGKPKCGQGGGPVGPIEPSNARPD